MNFGSATVAFARRTMCIVVATMFILAIHAPAALAADY